MSLQRDIFHASEGKAWLKRNEAKLGLNDPVTEIVKAINATAVLEIGCSNGWRLRKLKELGIHELVGIDPSVDSRVKDGLLLLKGTADRLPIHADRFDCVIFGFCLYLVDPIDYFKVVCESDRVLRHGGHIIIHDFGTHFCTKTPYSHHERLWSYRVDWPYLWLGSPAYKLRDRIRVNAHERVWVIRKDLKNAFELRQTSKVHVSSGAQS